ncbi:carbonic anhydrase 7 [Eurosta solidaginis]|uniref:carbonic anhydrase 7 n=1 Tax=Eurosta solidaginis TaxID=178769 RepID=UPI003530E11A
MRPLIVALLLTLICFDDFKTTFAEDFAYNGEMGPEHWSEHFSMCSGKHQSPINIDLVNVISRTYQIMTFNNFGTKPVSGEMLNNGHTVVVHFEYPENRPTVSGGPLDGKFVFEQLHFHWGDNDTIGSEDRINNVSFPAELHMVFRNDKYSTFAEAAAESNGITVLAYFYKIGENDNESYNEFTELLEEIVTPDTKAKFQEPPTLFQLTEISITQYYTYTGSLTTPPCSEDVTWIDFKTPITISAKQMDRFRHLNTYDNTPMTHNFRPLQPLNDRTVFSSIELTWEEDGNDNDIIKGRSAKPFVDILYGGAVVTKTIDLSNMIVMLLLNLLATTISLN